MSDLISLEVLTATETAVKADIRELYIPAWYGEAGILADHLPFISVLKSGEISYVDAAGKKHFLYIENGFMEVRDNRITIISDSTVKGENLDGKKLGSELSGISARIRSASQGGITPDELEISLNEMKKIESKLEIIRKSSSGRS